MKINFKALGQSQQTGFFIIDLFMIMLVMFNLVWMSLDWFFTNQIIKNVVAEISPLFFDFYANYIHPNFLVFDGIFVTIFLFELIIRWISSVRKKTYHQWFFYPFIHWYDVLGCIPLGTFRFLRLFRIISMGIRLQKLGVIDFRNNYIYQILKKYYEIVVEEVSDRVVVNVLNDVQHEIKSGNPVADKMVSEVINPQKQELVTWMSNRVKSATASNYKLYKDDIKIYLEKLVKEAVAANKEMKDVKNVPLIGSTIAAAIESAIGDITFNVINAAIEDIASNKDNRILEEITNIAFETILTEEQDPELSRIAKKIATDSVELIKEQVKIQQWKLKEEKKLEVKKRAKDIARQHKQAQSFFP